MAKELEISISKEDSYPEFDIPEGLDLSDLKEDGEKEVLAKIRKKSDGRICLISVDGITVGDSDEHEEEDEEGDYDASDDLPEEDVASSIMGRARAGGLM